MHEPIRPVAGVCAVDRVHGVDADPDAAPALLLEVPHGATRAQQFVDLWGRLQGDVPPELIDFFFVNTDVGAPELAREIAAQVTAAVPTVSALVVTSLLPRTLVDCNRRLGPDAAPQGSAAGQLSPGLPPWIRDPADQRLLLDLHATYARVAEAAYAAVCQGRGRALLVHSYAPRTLDVPVDDRIVEHLRAGYAADRIGQWPLRAEVDLITRDPDGHMPAPPGLVERLSIELGAVGREFAENGAYSLHPSTQAHVFSMRHPGRCLCFEVRRDLLVREFVPFRELIPDPAAVRAEAGPFARAVAAELR